MKNKALFTSNSDEWETPQDLFDQLNKEFNFTLDVCASDSNYKCKKYYTKTDNSLEKNWKNNTCWMNPPYSRKLQPLFIKKAKETSDFGFTVVCLLPARTDTKIFHDYIYKKPNVEIRFIKGRLKFSGAKDNAPFPSMIVIFYTGKNKRYI